MTTVTVTTAIHRLTDAAGAARQLRERLKTVVGGSNDETAFYDMQALATALETAAATFNATPGGGQDSRSYTLSWSTSGANDATTKTVALDWLYGNPSPPKCGLYQGHVSARSAPRRGADLVTLANAL